MSTVGKQPAVLFLFLVVEPRIDFRLHKLQKLEPGTVTARKAHVSHVFVHDNARNARIYANPRRAAKTDARRTDGRTDGQVHVCVCVANVLRSKPGRSTARCIRFRIGNRTADTCQAPGIERSCKPDANKRKLSAL